MEWSVPMSPLVDKKFDLGDYVQVKDRIAKFYELFGQGRLVTGEVRLSNEPDGVPRVMVQAFAYRTPDDQLPGVGWSWMVLPGTTNYTRGSELENVETSAWGRAIGALGILIDQSIASAQEVQNKASEPATGEKEPRPELERNANGLIGTVTRGSPPVDLELRYDSDHVAFWGFKLKNGRTGYQTVATGPLAETLSIANGVDGIEGQQVQVWGRIEMVPWRKGDRDMPPYPRIQIARVKAPEWDVPAEVEPPEAPTEPIWDDAA